MGSRRMNDRGVGLRNESHFPLMSDGEDTYFVG
jgi:hypothetical protein